MLCSMRDRRTAFNTFCGKTGYVGAMRRSPITNVESPAFFRELCPQLTISEIIPIGDCAYAVPAAAWGNMQRDGFMQLDHLLPTSARVDLLECVSRLVDAGLPPAFAFVYDAFWKTFASVARSLSVALGPLEVLPDFWVWSISPSDARGGWPPHRDHTKAVVRGADGIPTRMNVWLALTDAPREHACLSLVPLSEDPEYPESLNQTSTRQGRAFPVAAGAGLVWDANVLHWGNPADPRAKHPRVSAAMTLERPGRGVDFERGLSFHQRLDIVALQITRYEPYEPTLPEELRVWARTLCGLRRARGLLHVSE